MPFLPQNSFLSEEDKRKQQEQNNNMISGESGNSFTVGLPTATSNAGPKKSGSFTNLNKYLDANVEQSNQLGTDVSNKITSLGNEARTQFSNSKEQFSNRVNSGTIQNADSALDEVKGTVNKAYNKFANDQLNENEVSRFKDVTTAQYAGPDKIEDLNDLYNPAVQLKDKVNTYSKLSESDEGRANLLTDVYKRPSYSQGQVTFDNLLLSGNEQSRNKLKQASDQVSDVQNLFDTTVSAANKYAKDSKEKTDTIRNSAQQYTSDSQLNRNNEIQARLDDVKNRWSDEYNEYRNLLNSSNGGKDLVLSDQQRDKLDLKNYQRLYNMLKDTDAGAYLKQQDFDAQRVISKNEQAQLAALDYLANQFGGNQLSKYRNADIAETLTMDDAFDGSGFGQEARARNELFNKYTKDQNYTGVGSNTQSYNYGPGGMFKDSVERTAQFDINLADFLNRANLVDTGSGTYTNNYLVPGVVNDLIGNTLGSISDGRGDLWRDGSSEASRAAAAYAASYAKESLFKQIQAALDAQGFNNVVNGSVPGAGKYDPKKIPIKGR